MAHFMEILKVKSDDFNSVAENSSQTEVFSLGDDRSYWLNKVTYKEV